ncbi:hypothetical protein B9Z51_01710 [Limnohabitans sp. T6-5]|nr:hypothetical protein B9Z51_01710 [Limnohabitans sp. T6-5]
MIIEQNFHNPAMELWLMMTLIIPKKQRIIIDAIFYRESINGIVTINYTTIIMIKSIAPNIRC